MSQSDSERRAAEVKVKAPAASRDRELSDVELESVAGGGDKYDPPPPPPNNPGKKH